MNNELLHPCEIIYNLSSKPIYGEIEGVCRITGKESKGLLFSKWIKPTFTDIGYLLPGDIISNQALFCFDESSEEIMNKAGKDKLQRFRTYSHIVYNNEWYCLTKANKKQIFEMICNDASVVCLTDTGQKHVLFKHKIGMWQIDEMYVEKDLDTLKFLHSRMLGLMKLGFTQTSIISGQYNSLYIIKNGHDEWKLLEDEIKPFRGSKIFDFTAWMLYKDEQEA